MVKVNLQVVDKETEKVGSEQFEVKVVKIRQVTKVIAVIKDIVSLTKDDEDLKGLIFELFEGATNDLKDSEDDNFSDNILIHATGAIEVLLGEIPDKVVELLAALSGIDYELLMDQNIDDTFDIYDAVIKVNDIDKLIQRAKKSLGLTRSQVKVMNLFQKKEVKEIAKPKVVESKTTKKQA